jgi:hypothetical protein
MSERLRVTNHDIYKAKAERRKALAKMPFEQKIRALMRIQRLNLSMKKASGRHAPRPWDMSEEEYQRYLSC